MKTYSNILIAPKGIREYSPEEYHSYIQSHYELRAKRGQKTSPAPGLSLSKTKSGKLSLRRAKTRAFDYITMSELAALAKHAGCGQADLWNLLKSRNFIIAKDRLEAEATYGRTRE